MTVSACRGRVALASAVFLGMNVSHPAKSAEAGRSFEIYGFAMVDYIEDSKRVDPNWLDAFRPSKIADPEGEFGANSEADVSVKQSRFGMKGTMPTDGSPIDFKLEMDMFGVGADAGKTSLRLRHAYGEWGPVLGGQTNTLFMDIDVFPNVVDYWGPSGLVFVRTPQVRVTPYRTESSRFSMAIERPSNDVDPGNIRLVEAYESSVIRGHQVVPDLTAQFRTEGKWGHVQAAAILRRVGFEYQVSPEQTFDKGSETGWGLSLSGAWKTLDKDQLLLQAVYGEGIATYMNDGGMDLAPRVVFNPAGVPANFAARAVRLAGMSAYYDHYWNRLLSTSIGYSFTKVDNTNFQSVNAFQRGSYASVNLLSYPVEKLMLGGELLWGELKDRGGGIGHDVRFQFSAKYSFGISL